MNLYYNHFKLYYFNYLDNILVHSYIQSYISIAGIFGSSERNDFVCLLQK